METFEYYLVDVFTDKAFGGNQLAVFVKGDELDDNLLQPIAAELQLSETTFVCKPLQDDNDCSVRIFTPGRELPMAGHPTIGTAYVLLHEKIIKPKNENHLIFEEGVGDIRIDFNLYANGKPHSVFMYQPLPKFTGIFEDRKSMAELLSLNENDLVHELPVEIVSCGVPYFIVPVKSLEAIRKIKFRTDLFEKISLSFPSTFLYVYTLETKENDSTAHCRMFAPEAGIIEDPATGSAAGPLGCYLLKHQLISNTEAMNIVLEQGFQLNRKSFIHVQIGVENEKINKVKVGGNCVLMGRGQLTI